MGILAVVTGPVVNGYFSILGTGALVGKLYLCSSAASDVNKRMKLLGS